MLKLELSRVTAALRRDIPGITDAHAAARAAELIANTDSRLETNVAQWVNGQPISDLWIGKYCINAILAIRGEKDFLSALEAMNLYLQNPKLGELRIWRARR